MITEKIWHCFQVSDYKGGEFISVINLSTEDLLDLLNDYGTECTEHLDSDESQELLLSGTDTTLTKLFNDYYKIKYGENGKYAGYSGYTNYEIYSSSEDGTLIEDFPNEEEIAKFIRKSLKLNISTYIKD